MGWKPEVQTSNGIDQWAGNALVFATKEESDYYASDLMSRWTSVTDTRSREVEEAPTHVWNSDQQPQLQPIKK